MSETKCSVLDQGPPSSKRGYFYILQTPDVEDTVYKIGKTQQLDPNRRFCQYKKGVCVKYTIEVENCDEFEDYVMRKFRVLFVRRREYGLEYYQGSLKKMIDAVHAMWMVHGMAVTIEIDKELEKIKPNGFQAFANEWLSKQDLARLDYAAAYKAYTLMMKDEFLSSDYADEESFTTYLSQILI